MLTWCMSHPWMTFFIAVLAMVCINSCVVAIANAVILHSRKHIEENSAEEGEKK